jgi:hypothetical protein
MSRAVSLDLALVGAMQAGMVADIDAVEQGAAIRVVGVLARVCPGCR